MHHDVLRTIHEGMKVVDARNHEIGHVDWVQYGNDDPSTPAAEASSIDGMEEPVADTIGQRVIDAFRIEDDMPAEIRERLLMQGFVRIDAEGIFAADRYVLPDQIGSVSGDTLTLKVEKSQLVKRH